MQKKLLRSLSSMLAKLSLHKKRNTSSGGSDFQELPPTGKSLVQSQLSASCGELAGGFRVEGSRALGG